MARVDDEDELSRVRCYKTFYGRKFRLFVMCKIGCPWQAFPA